MRAKVYSSIVEARAEIAIEDAYRGYPVTEPGTRVGAGRFAESITTATSADPMECDAGFAVEADALTAPLIDKRGAVDVERKTVLIAAEPESLEEVRGADVRR